MKVAVLGATGLVGTTLLKVLEEHRFPVSELIPIGLTSIGNKVLFSGKEWTVVSPEEALSLKPDLLFGMAGSDVAKQWIPRFVEAGTIVVDNSSAFRLEPDVPLVVPEVNPEDIGESRLIANPNCSTIQMVVALNPLHKLYGIKKIVISTYQAVSGSGRDALEQLKQERSGIAFPNPKQFYPHQIDLNVLPHCDNFLEGNYTREELKLRYESRKIWHLPNLSVVATAVRVPVPVGHSESIYAEFEKEVDLKEVYDALSSAQGIILMDNPQNNEYPMPAYVAGKDEVFVGRIRLDPDNPKAIALWCVADNLRKGAATNAVQIAVKRLGL